jgi:hypothetical protein
MRNTFNILDRKPEEKIFGRHRHREEDNIKIDLKVQDRSSDII